MTHLSDYIASYRDDAEVSDELFAAFLQEAIALDGFSEPTAKALAPLVARAHRYPEQGLFSVKVA